MPGPDAGEANRHGIVADRVQHAAEAGAAQPDDHEDGDRSPHHGVPRDEVAEERAATHGLDEGGDSRRTLKHREGQRREQPEQDRGHGQRHDQRVDAEDPDADTVGGAGGDADGESEDDGDSGSVGRLVSGDVGGAGGDHRHRQVDPGREHQDRLAGGHDAQRSGEQHGVAHPARAEVVGLDRPGDEDEDHEDRAQHDERMLGEPLGACTPLDVLVGWRGGRRRYLRRVDAHRCLPLIAPAAFVARPARRSSSR